MTWCSTPRTLSEWAGLSAQAERSSPGPHPLENPHGDCQCSLCWFFLSKRSSDTCSTERALGSACQNSPNMKQEFCRSLPRTRSAEHASDVYVDIYVQLLYQYISDVLLLGYNKFLKSTCIKLNFISLKSNLDNNCYIFSKIKPQKYAKSK